MGRSKHLKDARKALRGVSGAVQKMKAGRFAGASLWRVIVSIVWPRILDKPRKRAQDVADAVHNRAVKKAIKKASHVLAKG